MEAKRQVWPFFFVMCLTAFGLNWLWEMAQMRAYTEMATVPWWTTAWPCTRAAGGDVVLTLFIYTIGALAAGQITWGMTAKWNVCAAAALMGSLCAAAYEWKAQVSGTWSYTAEMPIVPILGVGLWPLLQLTMLVPVSFWIAWWLTKTKDA